MKIILWTTNLISHIKPWLFIWCSMNFVDINECDEDTNACGQNSDCLNTEGSYECHCSTGYTGNGTVCVGKWRYVFKEKHLVWYGWLILLEVLPDIAGPEGQEEGGGSGSNIGLLAGVAAGGFLLVLLVLVGGTLFACKIRLRSKSVSLPQTGNFGFGMQIFFVLN